MNPQRPGGGANASIFVYSRLMAWNPNNSTYDLLLAGEFENPDPLTYIFKMRPSAKHQNLPPVNGRRVDAEDVKVSWDLFVKDPRTANKSLFQDYVDHYEIPEPYTFVVKMKKANAWAMGPHGLAGPLPTTVVPREVADSTKLETTAIGPGPYHLEKFDPASGISFTRRPDGWIVPERPYVDRVTYTVISDEAARAAAFKARQIDQLLARDRVQSEEFLSYGRDVGIDKELTYPALIWLRADPGVGMFADPRARQAVYCCLDMKELMGNLEFGDAEWCGWVPAYIPDYLLPADEVKKNFPHDVAKAKELLAASGWNSSVEVELKYPNSSVKSGMLNELLAKYLGAIGIKAKLVPQDTATVWNQTWTSRDFQVAAFYMGATYLDPDGWLRYVRTVGEGEGNRCHWSDAEVDDIVAKQQLEFDREKQKQLIMEAQRMLFRKWSPHIPVFTPYALTGRWAYYHPAAPTMGAVGTYGHYSWIDVDHPAYPKDRK